MASYTTTAFGCPLAGQIWNSFAFKKGFSDWCVAIPEWKNPVVTITINSVVAYG